ncbi:phosphatidylserine/phosphatidylglycerophosphate/cardiolipin synthase family protein [Erythrobacter litoralis]|uniref:phospholipase D-like domain-containing protein n=1 Tax=Erythrobacter litoralis TaxID=39960 RepID=UPI0024356748|nr:phosphatidylserine/phosphatidylglycerophosphate/cardiolipin synthase family protein [Erythrobacter litoralis]MDG6079070.1 phosphatidylserine/phosphatidylglycerophosphate/cardiolipin synthase family protein [Erythrobacter litoralis]
MGDDPAPTQASEYRDPPPFEATAAGQHLTFFPDGKDRREALLKLVAEAEERLDVCFYIFAEDAISTEFRDALCEAARRSVEVTLIIDRFGAAATDEFLKPLTECGGRFLCFSARWSRRYLIRNHQKIVIADGKRAMFGGFNIEDDYFAPPRDNGWNDLAILIEGSTVAGLTDWFANLLEWTEDEDAQFRAIRRAVRQWEWRDGEARWLIGGPTRGLSTWAKDVSDDLEEGERLDIFMAYFSPPRRLRRRIGRIAEKGRTRLLMAGKSDNGATIGAARALYRELLDHGACIWEFMPCKLHTKLIVLDDAVYMGSANFDMRSLYLNLELVLKIEDKALANRMREFVSQHLPASERITPELHARRSTLFNRMRWWAGWLLVSVVDYTVSRRLNLGI